MNPYSLLGFHRKHCNLNIQFSTQSFTGDSLSMTEVSMQLKQNQNVYFIKAVHIRSMYCIEALSITVYEVLKDLISSL